MTPTISNTAVTSPKKVRSRLDKLQGQRDRITKDRANLIAGLTETDSYLNLAPAIEQALEKLSEEMFGAVTHAIETHLTHALKEVLEQNLELKVQREFKNKRAAMSFHVERDGHAEDIMKGQGGSVSNVLSVGLRIFALKTLDSSRHRRFLVLDEQDCWLRPDLVPKLVKIVRDAGRALGFQVLMISHHDSAIFETYADRIYRFTPTIEGVKVEALGTEPKTADI